MKKLSIKINETILFVLSIFACAMLTICSCNKKTYDDKICRCFIFPTSSINNNYYIEISNNGMIKTSLGIRSKTILPVVLPALRCPLKTGAGYSGLMMTSP